MSEVRALLLTDVVDSTRLSAELGDAVMANVWAAHDRVARDLLPTWRGREIDKTDGMLLLFENAADAVNYAAAYHRGLAALPVALKARAGLHVASVMLHENSAADVARGAKPLEVEGLAKPTAARVMSIARGGQILLTAEAREALGETNLHVRSHGHWAMKGIIEPVELFEVGEPDASFAAPPDGEKVYRVVRHAGRWLPAREIPNNLPLQTTSFIGRERELDEIKAYLSTTRLLTLLGMGGMGKTRLSLQVAAEVMAEFPDGAWFLDLAPLSDPALVVSEAARTLGVRKEADRPVVQTLCAHLKPLRALLVLDSCEHLVKPSADLANAILRAAPGVQILASSREALRTPGEQTYPILPLPVPKRGDGVEALSRSAAVCLFVERARGHKPSFALNEREAPALAELVARLEGIPLALELAAARVRSLTVSDISARLKDRYKILTGGDRVLLERQQTLRALVDWSYDLLNDTERNTLSRLGVFAGGFDMAAAEAVCGSDALNPLDMFDLIGSLVEKSFVMLEERDDGARYRMLETIRDYAIDKLAQRGEMASTAARHCEHYFAMAKEAGQGLEGPEQADWIGRIEAELDNMRAAVALALGGGVDPIIAVKFAVALSGFWILRGLSTEGRAVVTTALTLPAIQESSVARAWAIYVGARLAESQSDLAEALRMLEACLVLRRGQDNPVDIAATLSTISLVRLQAGDPAGAEAVEQEALQIFRQLGDRIGEAIGLLHLGQVAIYRGDLGQATVQLEQCLAIARAIGSLDIEAECELHLGDAAMDADHTDRASQHFKRSLIVCREGADKRGRANALWRLGRVELVAGDIASSRDRLLEALQSFQAFGMRAELLGCLEDCAVLARLEGRTGDEARIAGAIDSARERLRLKRSPRAEELWRARVGVLRTALHEDEFEGAWGEGRVWQIDEAVRAAMSRHG